MGKITNGIRSYLDDCHIKWYFPNVDWGETNPDTITWCIYNGYRIKFTERRNDVIISCCSESNKKFSDCIAFLNLIAFLS